MASFKIIKNAIAKDLYWAATDPADDFLYLQHIEFINRLQKCKGWDELHWRVSQTFDFVKFKKYTVEGLLKAIELKEHPKIILNGKKL